MLLNIRMRTTIRRFALHISIIIAALGWGLWPSPALAQSSDAEVGPYLREIVQLAEQGLQASRTAKRAQTVAGVKDGADAVFEVVWGMSSGLAAEVARGATHQHGWKTRWQTTPAAFDSAFAVRLGTAPPEIDDPRELGILGRGRYLRERFAVAPDSAGPETPGARYSHPAIVASLSNAIGWMRLDNGITKGELQPRIDLTYQWDAPITFWQSTADTGWLNEAYAQAINILKTDYAGDVETAREHAAAMTRLLETALDGKDADGDGAIEPVMMEGGLRTALHEAEAAGLARR